MNRTVFWFESSSFPILPEEADEVNPHIHGKSLALWLGENLRAAGFVTREPFKEDFGWWTDVECEPPYKLMVVCAGEEPNVGLGGCRRSRGCSAGVRRLQSLVRNRIAAGVGRRDPARADAGGTSRGGQSAPAVTGVP